ncbi:hypothetical protein LLG96_02035 [bacterium]|nr:hypothetical protein [bacterium]
MTTDPRTPRFAAGKKRIEELRIKRARPSIEDTISRSRSMILVNLFVEIATGIILVIGLSYLVRFLIARRPFIDPKMFNLVVGCMAALTVGWIVYLFTRMRSHIAMLRKASSDSGDSSISDS